MASERLEKLDPMVAETLLLQELTRRNRSNRIDWYYPDGGPLRRELYQKSLEFFKAGHDHTERLLMAANRVGKTEGIGGYEMACHLTGIYPVWWIGRRFTKPIRAWCGGDTSLTVRDILQFKLLGPVGQYGTGLLRASTIIRTTPKRNVADAVDTVAIRHVTGGISYLAFKSYDQGRVTWQGTEQDVIWLDEEPPPDIYSEALTRTMTTKGMVMSTFTPLKGMGDVIMGFMTPPLPDHKFLMTATWDDVPHLGAAEKKKLWESYSPAERDARSKGIPVIGSGRIYPVIMDDVLIDDFIIPPHFRKSYALDVGWKKTAALWGAHDADSDIIYYYSEHYAGQAEPAIHASSIKGRGAWIHGVIDPASRGRSQQDGEQLMDLYEKEGLLLTMADNSVEAGLNDTWQRLSTGRIRVFRKSCPNWQQEFPLYHRDEKGQVVKKMDHVMDCMRYHVRSGVAVAEYSPSARTRKQVARRNWRTA